MENARNEQPILEVQKQIREHGLGHVVDHFKLVDRYHKQHPNLVLLKYRQQGSNFGEEVVQECRGLILDMDNDYRIVSYPYKKFFNYGEKWACKLDWSSAMVAEKLDGSLCTLYWYKGSWHVSSSGVPDASANLDSCGQRFSDLFWRIWKAQKLSMPTETNFCYMFEMLSNDNIIVTRPGEDRIVLHGARDIRNLKEVHPDIFAKQHGWPLAKTTRYNSVEEVIDAAKLLNPSLEEGFVVCDAEFNRLKVKSPQYVALSLMNATDSRNLNYNHMTKIVRAHEGSEFLAYFPAFEPLYRVVSETFKILMTSLEKSLVKVKKQFPDPGDVSVPEVRLMLTNLLDSRHPDALETYSDIILKLVKDPSLILAEVLEKWPIDHLVVLMHQFHGPNQKAALTKYKASLPKKTKGLGPKNDDEDIDVPKAKVDLEYDFEPYEKPSIQRAKEKMKQEQMQREIAATSSSSSQPRKGAKNRNEEWEEPEKLSKREQRRLDQEFEEALRFAKQLDETNTRAVGNNSKSKKELRQEDAKQKQLGTRKGKRQ